MNNPQVIHSLLTAFALLFAVSAWWSRREAVEILSKVRSLATIEAEIVGLREAYERLLSSHKRLRSSEGMARLRDERRAGVPSANPYSDPIGWKQQKRLQLGLIHGKATED